MKLTDVSSISCLLLKLNHLVLVLQFLVRMLGQMCLYPSNVYSVNIVVSSICSFFGNLIYAKLFNIKHCKPLKVLIRHPFVQVWSWPIFPRTNQSIVFAFKGSPVP